MKCYCLLNIAFDHADEVIAKIKQIPNISVVKTYGVFDALVTIFREDSVETKQDVVQNIRKLEYVNSTLSLIGTDHRQMVDQS